MSDAQGARPPKPQQPAQGSVPPVPAPGRTPEQGDGSGQTRPGAAAQPTAAPAQPLVPGLPPLPAQQTPQPPQTKPGPGGRPPGRQDPRPAPAPPAQPLVQQSQAVRQPRPAARTVARTRSARLRISRADPWSVMKVSFLLSIALGITSIVAVTVLWSVLDALGVFSTVGGTIADATGSGQQTGFDLQSFLSLSHVVLATAVIAVIDVVLATALATLGAFLYNLSAGFAGGVELTLAEDE